MRADLYYKTLANLAREVCTINETPFDELYQKARACGSTEELLAFARESGEELTDRELEAISGGWGAEKEPHCPYCDGKQFTHP